MIKKGMNSNAVDSLKHCRFKNKVTPWWNKSLRAIKALGLMSNAIIYLELRLSIHKDKQKTHLIKNFRFKVSNQMTTKF